MAEVPATSVESANSRSPDPAPSGERYTVFHNVSCTTHLSRLGESFPHRARFFFSPNKVRNADFSGSGSTDYAHLSAGNR